MSNLPVVSVVIPTYNHADFLREALQSVCMQSYTNWEVIVVNNYSDDDTVAVVESFDDSRIRLENFHNNGIIYVKNDWINEVNNGAMDSLTGTVNLFGDNQFIDGSFTTTFNNLTLSGTGTKTLNINTIVGGSSGILSLNDRPLDLNKKTLTITNPIASTITRTSGYIISESNSSVGYGMVYWRCANTIGNYTVPFGSFAADYIPFTFNISTAGNNAGIKKNIHGNR